MASRQRTVSAMSIGRRSFVVGAIGAFALPALAQAAAMEVWRDPYCGCCEAWVAHVRAAGFVVADRVVPSVSPFRRVLGTPMQLLSCHAARVGGLAIEGHVPAGAIRRMLAERRPDVRGIAVPAMPIGTPGMEVEGREPETYDVVVWFADGTFRPWVRMRGAEFV